MPTLNDLTTTNKAHWELHLNAVIEDTPSLRRQVRRLLRGPDDLPNIRHPAYVHDWLEYPEMRTEIEAYNG